MPSASALSRTQADRGDGVVVRHRVADAVHREPVVDADDDGAGPGADLAGRPVGLAHVEVAAEEAAAVRPDEARPARPRRRPARRCAPARARADRDATRRRVATSGGAG